MKNERKTKLSPMMDHYMQKKAENPDCLLLYRLGDFYECFFDDALTVSKELEITLTARDCGEGEKAPMCGVPYHALDSYLAKLVNKGYKVAICEQLSTPQPGKMVDRDIIRIVTPGTVVETEILDAKRNNFLASIYLKRGVCGIAYLDISTGEFYATSLSGDNLLQLVNDELLRIQPSEIISNSMANDFAGNLASIAIGQLPKFNSFYEWAYTYTSACNAIKNQYGVETLQSYDIADKDECVCACGALIEYCLQTQKRKLNHLKPIKFIRNDLYMHLDSNARKNLEIVETMKDGRKQGTLLSVLDYTKTSMGARFFKSAIEQPFQNENIINERLDAVEEIVKSSIIRESLIQQLDEIGDIERICSKVVYGSISPKDCLTLKRSLIGLPKIKSLLEKFKSSKIAKLNNEIVDFNALIELLESSIKEDAGALLKDGNFIKDGFNKTLDEYRHAKEDGAKWLASLEKIEIEQTGIKNLKIKYNRVFGYLIEVPKSNIDKVPNRYIRKQTIANNERYVTEELKEIESKILNSEENAQRLENEIFDYIKSTLNQNIKLLLDASASIAEIDFLTSLAYVAVKNNYVKPIVSNNLKELSIVEGRHPVVEVLLKSGQFIPNDIVLNETTDRIMILTGPNMAGKSTYMRQVAIIVLMAHIGSFVPCKEAKMPTFDRIFTRVGASDDLAFGQSTFMVEMSEVATILNNATDRSLIILDEVGRGTSTYDGLSIAWAIMEYLSSNFKAKTLFATHYHELTELEGMLDGVKNYRISVKESETSGIVFLRKIVRGGASKSFGIEVAKLAGIPSVVTKKAKEILTALEKNENSNLKDLSKIEIKQENNNVMLDKYNKIADEITSVDINNITPFKALEILSSIREKIIMEE